LKLLCFTEKIDGERAMFVQVYFALPAFLAHAVPQYFALASKVVKVFLQT